jgi:ATP-dependent Clp endopeptidase proteolytic subunit ClpP
MKVKDGYLSLSIQNQKKEADLELYGVVGGDWFGDGITAKQVVDALKEIPSGVTTLNLHINSPGGSVTEGMAIYNRLKQQGAKMKIIAHIDALAASIASVIMLAADEIRMSDTGFVMIHKPWTQVVGNADDMDKTIQILDEIEAQMLNLYIKKTKKTKAEIKQLLSAETWLSAQDAYEFGFIDTMTEGLQIAACAVTKANWIKNSPKALVTNQKIALNKIDQILNARKKAQL